MLNLYDCIYFRNILQQYKSIELPSKSRETVGDSETMRTVNSTKRFRTRKRGHQRENDVVSRGTGTGTGTASPRVATDVGTVWNVKWITRAPQGNNAFLVASNVWHLGRRYLRVIIFEISVSSRAFALHRAVFSVYPGRVAPSYHAKFPSYHRSLSYIHRRADRPSV